MAKVVMVSPEDLEEVWKVVEDMIAAGLAQGSGTVRLEDLYKLVASQDGQLWVAFDEVGGKKLIGSAIVTEVIDYPGKRVVFVHSAGGNDLRDLSDGVEALENWALTVGAKAVGAQTRKGLAKVLERECGWQQQAVVVVKELARVH